MASESLSYHPVKPLNWTKAAVCQFASDLAAELTPDPGADLEPVIHLYGGEIEPQGLFDRQTLDDGSIQVEADGRFKVFLPNYVSAERNRFTLAHEFGHYVLHFVLQGRKQAVQASRLGVGGDERAEWEANWFAAAFLMPEKPFLTALDEASEDYRAVAARFRVSREAARLQAGYYRGATASSG